MKIKIKLHDCGIPILNHGPVCDPFSCPKCHKKMIWKHNKKTGKGFYGCSNYPICNGTWNGEGYD